MRLTLPVGNAKRITLPIRGFYKINGEIAGKYLAEYGVENLNFAYVGNGGQNNLGFGMNQVMADFVPGAMVRPLNIGYGLTPVQASLTIQGVAEQMNIGFQMSASPVFIRSAEDTELGVGFATSEASAALVRKTVLGDFDGLTFGEMDDQLLYDLAYITIE